ncbi:nitrogen regulation protein NR(I) [Gallionella capsiferriformans]|jgi:two-component system nitrogen regulation response regulator GlnG|uniref:DNA-binding transcriptional regulator NtrC n=1 Tax=Gallionella capsiferriformans (strain ES-2) TaxID=395494 RepID=D9SHR6_GALCS|nr:nitrogen regulation protein NR(I) [Gallionella capsiferriformans]ADL54099.1 nitrogen metabolism transcriptional regulator, NtrC, Fis Family [Gallionella capsiferriformans ES-2]
MKPVWIIDDDRSIRWVLEKSLARANIEFESFQSADDAQRALSHDMPQVVVSDIRMPGISGLDFLQTLHERHPLIPVIIMTAYSDLESAVSAFQGGAFEYLPKPFDINHAVDLIRRALEQSRRKSAEIGQIDVVADILGHAPAMQDVFRAIGRLSQSHATVLINGESGTGKELVARALHRHSPRAEKPFIAINTAAIPKDLLESELFGHERGAFTGAAAVRHGRFEQAEGGTLFLDEIGDMPSELQTRLLRVLSDGNYYRVGGHQPIKANVRIITATHQNLEERVKLGLFREDLFHRLNVIRLRLPPLRERSEDIPLLAKFFLQKSAQELAVECKQFGEATLQHLSAQDFPGNVRQLENLCHWLTVMTPSQVIEIADLPPEWRENESAVEKSGDWSSVLAGQVEAALQRGDESIMDRFVAQFERTLILQALQHTNGRRIEAATLLGIGRNTLTRKIQELGLDEQEA